MGSLKDTSLFWKEMNHRVKGHLQTISSVLALQADASHDEDLKRMLRETQGRIGATAILYEMLSHSEPADQLNIAAYFQKLINELSRIYRFQGNAVDVIVEAPNCAWSTDIALPCGLILNELICNALDHAFPRQIGQVRINLSSANQKWLLTVKDNGKGIAIADVEHAQTLGLQIVTALVRQLRGTIEIHGGSGTEINLAFPFSSSAPGEISAHTANEKFA